MYLVLDKDTIKKEIVPYLPSGTRGFPTKFPVEEIINAILYKLKTGVKWGFLPVKALFREDAPSWQTVCHHFRKWSVEEAWKACWTKLLERHKRELDLWILRFDLRQWFRFELRHFC